MKSRVSPPLLKNGQFSVLTADTDTGIVLNLEGEYHIGNGEVFRIFDSIDKAVDYCITKTTEYTKFECVIYDHEGKFVRILNPNKI